MTPPPKNAGQRSREPLRAPEIRGLRRNAPAACPEPKNLSFHAASRRTTKTCLMYPAHAAPVAALPLWFLLVKRFGDVPKAVSPPTCSKSKCAGCNQHFGTAPRGIDVEPNGPQPSFSSSVYLRIPPLSPRPARAPETQVPEIGSGQREARR